MENNLQALPMLSFGQAVESALKQKYVTFTGRARRSEYWFFALFSVIVYIVAMILDNVLGLTFGDLGYGVLYCLCGLALLLPSLAVAIRRLHDIGRTGWWILIAFVPFIGGLVLLVFACLDSQPQANKYGTSPKYVSEAI